MKTAIFKVSTFCWKGLIGMMPAAYSKRWRESRWLRRRSNLLQSPKCLSP
ncbi:Uncharacterised protein [Vibrio cholerae]|nr:Uncharacterised protein [Vibrio cholerae]CSI21122.1 Uncharacterised protein [Vibrio cholerae]CSI64355.1 Uncharacterised protein [Vibrio cholerae]